MKKIVAVLLLLFAVSCASMNGHQNVTAGDVADVVVEVSWWVWMLDLIP